MDVKKYPFKILDSYVQSDADIYFGRDAEKDQLYEMVFQTNIVLVYGPVGTGKTSLIQCGLAQKFDEYDWSCLFVRRNKNLNQSLLQVVTEKVKKVLDEIEWEEELKGHEQRSLSQLLSVLYLNSFKPIYLIFDQFEELFILGDREEEGMFIDFVRQTLEAKEPIKMIFCLREEYLGYLANFEKKVPELFRKKIRVEPMGIRQIEAVLKGATSSANSNVNLKNGEEDEICSSIFDVVKGNDKVIRIQLPYLQVYLHKLYVALLEPGDSTVTITVQAIKNMGGLGDVLRDFVESEVRSLVSPTLTEGDIWTILSPFATLKGTKVPISMQMLYENVPGISANDLNSTVQSFVRRKILKYIEDKDLYEFVHDSIAQKVAEKRDRDEVNFLSVKQMIENQLSSFNTIPRYFDEQQLKFIDLYLERLDKSNSLSVEERALIEASQREVNLEKGKEKERQMEELRKARRLVRYVIVICLVISLLLIIAIYSFMRYQGAEQNRILQGRIHEASTFKETGDEFYRLGKLDDARDSYTKALEALKGEPGDLLYEELVKRKKACE